MVQERFLYHSFPRGGAGAAPEIEKGLQILACMRDIGLLLVPEAIEWRQPVTNQPDRTFPVVQPRVCFTDLSPDELSEHAERFGQFAIEFDFETARKLGAIPVFYVPQREGGIAVSLMAVLLDARAILSRAAVLNKILNGETPVAERLTMTTGFARNPEEKRDFNINRDESKILLEALGHHATPWPMLSGGMDALLNFFYPADNIIHDKPLEYYQQREWRIACNFALNGIDVLRAPTPDEVNRIRQIDDEFFRRPIPTDFGPIDPFSRSLVHPGLGAKTILQLARRVVAPRSAIARTEDLLNTLDDSPPLVALEDM